MTVKRGKIEMNGILVLSGGKLVNGDGFDIEEILKISNEILKFIGGQDLIDNPNDDTVKRVELKDILDEFIPKYGKKKVISALMDLESTGMLSTGRI